MSDRSRRVEDVARELRLYCSTIDQAQHSGEGTMSAPGIDPERLLGAVKTVVEARATDGQALHALLGRLVPVDDPLRLDFDPFSAFQVAYSEPRWTLWLRACLVDPFVGRYLRQALSHCVARQARRMNLPEDCHTADDWRSCVPLTGRVECERPIDGGRLDLSFESGASVVVLELKLWSDTSDTPGEEPQLSRYERDARHRAAGRKLGFVFLAVSPTGYVLPQSWVPITWEQVALALRRELPGVKLSHDTLPLWQLIAAIERHLLFHQISSPARRDVAGMRRLVAYLTSGGR